jgi:hypothetical protein
MAIELLLSTNPESHMEKGLTIIVMSVNARMTPKTAMMLGVVLSVKKDQLKLEIITQMTPQGPEAVMATEVLVDPAMKTAVFKTQSILTI